MRNKPIVDANKKLTKKQWALFTAGLIAIIIGVSIIGFYGIRKICRDINRQIMFKENVVIEIPELKVKAPVLEGTDNETLAKAVGHFTGTGDTGSG
ncbi:MAG: hypothetical protein K2N49_04755, partial [Ruminococcus sp.]|nr:hypothetical protein [Ruminococcus sp.]